MKKIGRNKKKSCEMIRPVKKEKEIVLCIIKEPSEGINNTVRPLKKNIQMILSLEENLGFVVT